MKKNRLFGLLLAAMMTVQAVSAPVFAVPDEEIGQIAASSDPTATVPPTTEYVIPAGITGDASIHMGSRTLDAQRPLADAQDYKVNAKAALLYEMNSDTLVLAQDADVQLYPASLTKVMTCLLAIEMGQMDEMVTVTSSALADLSLDGSSAGLIAGEQLRMEDMLYCLMVSSGNDAAAVLAEHLAGDIDSFVEQMNQKALELGCTGTHFANPHGLHDENHYTTARDLAKIFKAALEYPIFHEIYSVPYYTVPATNLSEPRELKSTNYLIRNAGYPVVLDSRILGGKTGFTTPAGRCLVALAERDGMMLMSVLLGTTAIYGPDGYSVIRYGNFEENINLLDFAYDTFTTELVMTSNQIQGQFAVSNGANDAFGVVDKDMYAVLPKGSDFDTVQYQYDVDNTGLTAPLAQGAEIGVLRVWYQDKCLAQQPLRAASDVAVKVVPQLNTGNGTGSQDFSKIWNTLLLAALGVLLVAAAFVVLVRVRASIRRAKRRKRRAAAQHSNPRRRRQ